jgi:hypothetical protein
MPPTVEPSGQSLFARFTMLMRCFSGPWPFVDLILLLLKGRLDIFQKTSYVKPNTHALFVVPVPTFVVSV